ncbi:hypothetical protein [Luteolibacter marinus]|uniref:hypothetical protein n=1 Tax=Luteolibacter marinus TaxID=2776705 RepID=UPI001869207E|nr:hypothetical protein [Luteolibacter marinus]
MNRPELLGKWFTPKPWTTISCEIDLRARGLYKTTMRSPEGQDLTLETSPSGMIRYTARAVYWSAEAIGKQAAMGFPEGWGAASDQFVKLVKNP